MPITPHFNLSQTTSHVLVEIRVPHVRVSINSVEVVVDGPTLHFASPPYLLILNFPAQFAETDASDSAKYDPSRDGGMVTLELRKLKPDMWQDLDLLGQLMRPKAPKGSSILRAEILSEERMEGGEGGEEEEEEDATTNIGVSPENNLLNIGKPSYGFLNQFDGIFTDLVREGLAVEMLQLPAPDETKAADRRKLRLEAEDKAFDPDRYLGDLDIQDDYIYQCAMGMQPHWETSVDSLADQMASLKTTEGQQTYFSDEESAKLASISYPILPSVIDTQNQRSLLLGVLDILFAYVYDHLITDGDPTIESSWTVCNLSCTLSWLEKYDTIDNTKNVICSSVRRSLIYPYIRNVDFALHCWNQVATIVQTGRRCIIRCLLQVRSILDKSEVHYLGNRLYIDPYLGWIQSRLKDDTLMEFGKELKTTRTDQGCWIKKTELGFQLLDIERYIDGESEAGDEETVDDNSGDESNQSSDDDITIEQDEKSARRDIKQTVVSSALLDSEIGSLGMLQISDDEKMCKASNEGIESPKQKVNVLIQEL